MIENDIQRLYNNDDQWYRKVWTLDIKDQAWVEKTGAQVDFIIQVLGLQGGERILDLACGFGRHALEFARRGYQVTGVDITPAYIGEAKRQAKAEGLVAEFICYDLRELRYDGEFDVAINMADGAIGYLENDAENEKLFDVIAAALVPGGKHLADFCSGDYAAKHFPSRHWLVGEHSLALADFTWDAATRCMFYGGKEFKFGEPLAKPTTIHCNPTRVYGLSELAEIMAARGMQVQRAYADFDASTPATDDTFQIQVVSRKAK